MFECETHHYLDGFATPPTGWWWTKSTRFRLRRPVMVGPIANGADIEIPVVIVGAGVAGLSSGGRTGLGLPSW
jgi:hypothetical protein